MRWYHALLVSLAAAGLTACVIVPVPVNHTVGREVDVDPKKEFAIGVTTREDVAARFGEPNYDIHDDAHPEGGHLIAYSWLRQGLLLAGGGLNTPGIGGSGPFYIWKYKLTTNQYLIIRFDGSDHLVWARRVEKPGDYAGEPFLRDLFSSPMDAPPSWTSPDTKP
ncbi:MAG TPA: hypothetical protein VMU06_10150 [Stellaceae bacterium]|nr:hypothetical protein [Stellaceae bacterium]